MVKKKSKSKNGKRSRGRVERTAKDKRLIKIAKATLKLPYPMSRGIDEMTKDQAAAFLRSRGFPIRKKPSKLKKKNRRNPPLVIAFKNPKEKAMYVWAVYIDGDRTAELYDTKRQAQSAADRFALGATSSSRPGDTVSSRSARVKIKKELSGYRNPAKSKKKNKSKYKSSRQKRFGRRTASGHRAYAAAHLRKKPKGRMSNPEANYDAEIEAFEEFQGRAAQKLTKIADEIYVQDKFALLGDLCELNFAEHMHGERFDENGMLWESNYPKLCCNGDRTQLYAFCGDQKCEKFADTHGIDINKDLVDLGELESVVYRTRKAQANFKDATFQHPFGEDKHGKITLPRPRLMYDVLNKRIHFVGGVYKIEPEGITG